MDSRDETRGPRADAAAEAAPTLPAAVATPHRSDVVSTAPTVLSGEGATVLSGDSSAPPVDVAQSDLSVTRGAARYEASSLLGQGGMGEVRLHVDRRIGRRVAKKTLLAQIDSPVARERFLREVRVQGQLEHPAIVPVYDLDVDERGQVYFTMKRVRGDTLEGIIERLADGDEPTAQRFGQRRLLAAFAQVCNAIEYAHTHGVLHRDLKPSNVMLGDFGEVYVLDWGLAKIVDEAEAPTDDAAEAPAGQSLDGVAGALTAGGAILGTPAYMAPEQLLRRGEELDARADIYALGAILFEILTLTRLRQTLDLGTVLTVVARGDLRRPSEVAPDTAPELDALCARMLAPARDDRPGSAREVSEAIERFLDGDRDLGLRRAAAARHAAEARRLAPVDGAGGAHVEALREALKALAFDATNADAQRLLLEILTHTPRDVPPAAQGEYGAEVRSSRASGARLGYQGLTSWLLTLPVAMLIGVESWVAVGALALATAVGALVVRAYWRRGGYGFAESVTLALIVATVIALTSCYLGPFMLMPTCAATASILFAIMSTPRERPWTTGLIALGAIVPFATEIGGWLPRAYDFRPGQFVVAARALALPEGATMGAMAYSTLSFIVLAGLLVGRLRDALSAAERRHFLQAWYLRQLFPPA